MGDILVMGTEVKKKKKIVRIKDSELESTLG